MAAAPTGEERAAVDEILGPPASGWVGGERSELDGHVARGGREARDRRGLLLPALHALQHRVGWISEGGLSYVAQRLTVPPAEAYGVASFYALFSTEPRPPTVLHLCDDIACKTAGADVLIDDMVEALGPERSREFVRSPCLGMCDRAPAAFVQSIDATDISFGPASLEVLRPFVAGEGWGVAIGTNAAPQTGDDQREGLRLLRRVGVVDPTSLDDYRAHGGYEALRRAVDIGPEGVIRELKDSKLLGRGGAAFPTGVKWEAVARQPVRPHYFVCNADESEPGTFKDRVLMEQDPFAVIEALTIAGFATASEKGYLYVRGEYPLATERLEHAIEQARARGLLGEDVMGEGFAFDVEIRRGAGAYIAGEETALFNSIEGRRAEPRNKPPFPVERGLFGKPTGINNVETLVNVLEVLAIGGEAYTRTGTPDSTGTRLFCLSGCVERPGVYEVECGTRLRDLFELAGGVRGGKSLKAILLGGAAGGFVTPDDLDLPLSFEGVREAGVTLGSGVVMVFDEAVDLVDIVLRIAAFFRDESCGQCVPCRVGTVRQEEALHRLVSGGPIGSPAEELRLLGEVAQVMRDASICGLGQTAASAVQSAISRLSMFDGTGG
ncbi:MAG TPA: NAD(P)H-dependent oxidoreductase subunit E [Actinomycetota bacterium]|jgi:NADH-quinone oxidoreductase subunit F|nr:NAD(P)H-dependent oxidoreductase subunit E [Actinomycetota bacterium]